MELAKIDETKWYNKSNLVLSGRQAAYYPVFFISIFLFSCSEKKINNSLSEDNLKGNVMSVTEITRHVKTNNAMLNEWFDATLSKYNNNGSLSLRRFNNSYGREKMDEEYIYDDKGRCIEKHFLDGNNYDGVITYKYDEKGNRIESNYKYRDGRSGMIKYAYDNGNLIEKKVFDNDGNLGTTIKYKYDNKGNQVEEDSYTANGSLSGTIKRRYDSKGNKIEESDNGGDKSLSKDVYKYDNKNNLIEEQSYDKDGLPSPQLLTYKYENYDQQGNWLLKTDEFLHRITEREITYYSATTSKSASNNSTPEEFKSMCVNYKIYYDPNMRCYIFKLRNSRGGYVVYQNGDKYYCKMEVALNSHEFMYYGRDYDRVDIALQALEQGTYGDMLINYDDNLDIEYLGQTNSAGLMGSYEKGSIKKRCTVICE